MLNELPLFHSASHFIVSQVNFHVVPLLNKAHHPSVHTTYWKMFQMLEWDIRSRALNLSRLGLFPKIFGQDISKIFKQKYHGNITIVPRFTKMSAIGLNALLNPTVEDMTVYIQVSRFHVVVNLLKHVADSSPILYFNRTDKLLLGHMLKQ